MKYTFKQVFSIVDGRLSTDMGDVYRMLNEVTGESLMTHHLPTAMSYIEKVQPDWYVNASDKLNKIKEVVGDDFDDLMEYIDEMCFADYVEITEMTEKQLKGFGKHMVDNSLLKKIGTKS